MGMKWIEVGWMESVDWLQRCVLNLSLGSVALSSLSCISPRFFSPHFPSQFLFVVGENCASMQSKAFSVRWPVFKCCWGVLLSCSSKLLLIWRCEVSLLSCRFIHLGKHGMELQIWLKLWLYVWSVNLGSPFEWAQFQTCRTCQKKMKNPLIGWAKVQSRRLSTRLLSFYS